jgi:hypothetical protein
MLNREMQKLILRLVRSAQVNSRSENYTPVAKVNSAFRGVKRITINERARHEIFHNNRWNRVLYKTGIYVVTQAEKYARHQ